MIRKTVVVVGGGFAGSEIARKLENNFKTILIDNKDYFEYTPGILRTIVEPNHKDKLQVFHKDYLSNFVKADVTEVAKDYVMANDKKISFDYLVIATGSTYHLPFKQENCISSTRAQVLVENFDKIESSKKIVIIGGGIVGVELAAELATHYKRQLEENKKELLVVHSRDRLMPDGPEKASKSAEKFLRKNNVKFIFNERASDTEKRASDNKKSSLITDKGTKIEYETVFLCTGIRPNSDIMIKNFKDKLIKNYIKTNEYLQLDGFKNIFVAGDVTDIRETKLAQNAEKHAEVIIENIKNLEDKKPLIKYESKPRLIVISLGKYKGILTHKNFVMTGFIPGIMKSFIEYWIMKKYK